MSRPKKKPIYTLAHGVKVLTESRTKRYMMCLIEAHHLFPGSKVSQFGRMYIQRGRVVMTARLGRPLGRNEHVHHGKKGRFIDTVDNLSLLSAAAHNRHHKRGSRHKASSKKRISESLLKAYASGRRKKPNLKGKRNPFFGRRHTKETKDKMKRIKRA